MSELIGREAEQDILRRVQQSRQAELIGLYGRRRVGKTFLVRQFFGEQLCLDYTGACDATVSEQLANFGKALRGAKNNRIRDTTPESWPEAFGQLQEYLDSLPRTKKWAVFLDELPWLATQKSGFLPALDHFWNSWAVKQPHLAVVVCGSAASWMIRHVVHHRGGLHNRLTKRIRLEPFTLGETLAFLKSRGIDLGQRQTLELYLAMGGVPHYLKEVEPGRSATQNIDRICFSPSGLLWDEFDQLYASLFDHADRHINVVRQLATTWRGMTRSEVLLAADVGSGGGVSDLLDELVESGFVMRSIPFGKSKKDTLFRLVDEYSSFYLNWIEKHRSRGPDVWMKKQTSPAYRTWAGYAFEGVCLKHLKQLKRALGIAGVETTEASWLHRPGATAAVLKRKAAAAKRAAARKPLTQRAVKLAAPQPVDEGAQIDLLIDRKDQCINLCEMKLCESEFVIDKAYAADLRRKREVFRQVTGTRKAIFMTLVTPFGVKPNEYSHELIANTITLEPLFKPLGTITTFADR